MNNSWPKPYYDKNREPHFLFIVTPPYSGSTCLSRLINTSPKTTLLHPSGEAQRLIPSLCGRGRWKAGMQVDYESLKAVWLNTYHNLEKLVGGIEVAIEKSPPNMMRMEKICAQFSNYSLLANNRDPYASCASRLYRDHLASEMSAEQRLEQLEQIAKAWLERSRKIRELTTRLDAPLLTYEQFCAHPRALAGKLQLHQDVVSTIQFDASVKVKDYPPQQIANQNSRQISQLSNNEIDAITRQLDTDKDLLEFYDYQLLS